MAIQKQTIPLLVGGGVANKQAEYLVESPNAHTADNVVFNKDGEVQKRNGFAFVANPTNTTSRYMVHGNDRNLIYLSGQGAEILSTNRTTFRTIDLPDGVTTAAELPMTYSKYYGVIGNEFGEDDSLQTPGVSASTARYTINLGISEGVYVIAVYDHVSQEQVASTTVTTSALVNPAAFSINDSYLCIAALNASGNIVVHPFNTANRTFGSTVTQTVSGTCHAFDVCNAASPLSAAIAWSESGTAYMNTFSGTAFGTRVTVDSGAYNNALQSVSICTHSNVDGSNAGYIMAYADTTPEININSITSAGTAGTPVVVATYSPTSPHAAALNVVESPYGVGTNGEVVLTTDIMTTDRDSISLTYYHTTRTYITDMTSGGNLADADDVPGALQYSRMIEHPNGSHVCAVFTPRYDLNRDSGGLTRRSGGICQPMIVMVLRYRNDATYEYEWAPIGYIGAYNLQITKQVKNGSTNGSKRPSNWELIATDVYRFASLAIVGNRYGSEFHDIDLSPTHLPKIARNDVLYWGGGMLWQYDGATTSEVNALATPFIENVVSSGTASVTFALNTEWVDNRGDVHRSPVSNTYSIAYNATDPAVIEYQLPPSSTEFGRAEKSQKRTVLYRTSDAGSIFYRTAAWGFETGGFVTSSTQSGETAVATDASIEDNGILYTQGELAAEAVPAPVHLAVSDRRMWAVSGEQRDEVWASKTFVAGVAPEFSSALRIRIPVGGDITGLATLDEKLIVFKKERTFMVYGPGPNNAGQGQAFAYQELQVGVGCIDDRSILTGPFGVMFRAEAGLYILDRGLQAQYIGGSIENYLTDSVDIVSAVLIPEDHEARFCLDDDTILVFNYLFNRWSRFTRSGGINMLDSTLYEGLHTLMLRNDGNGLVIMQETPDVFEHTGAGDDSITYTYSTPWIKLSGLEGYQRIQRALFLFRDRDIDDLGSGDTESDITINVYYDYDNTTSSSFSISGFDIVENGARGQVEIHIPRQKTESIRFEVVVTDATAAFGASVAFTGLQLIVGMKQGGFKLPAGQKA